MFEIKLKGTVVNRLYIFTSSWQKTGSECKLCFSVFFLEALVKQ